MVASCFRHSTDIPFDSAEDWKDGRLEARSMSIPLVSSEDLEKNIHVLGFYLFFIKIATRV